MMSHCNNTPNCQISFFLVFLELTICRPDDCETEGVPYFTTMEAENFVDLEGSSIKSLCDLHHSHHTPQGYGHTREMPHFRPNKESEKSFHIDNYVTLPEVVEEETSDDNMS